MGFGPLVSNFPSFCRHVGCFGFWSPCSPFVLFDPQILALSTSKNTTYLRENAQFRCKTTIRLGENANKTSGSTFTCVPLQGSIKVLVYGYGVDSDCAGGSDCPKWVFDPGAARIARGGFLQKSTSEVQYWTVWVLGLLTPNPGPKGNQFGVGKIELGLQKLTSEPKNFNNWLRECQKLASDSMFAIFGFRSQFLQSEQSEPKNCNNWLRKSILTFSGSETGRLGVLGLTSQSQFSIFWILPLLLLILALLLLLFPHFLLLLLLLPPLATAITTTTVLPIIQPLVPLYNSTPCPLFPLGSSLPPLSFPPPPPQPRVGDFVFSRFFLLFSGFWVLCSAAGPQDRNTDTLRGLSRDWVGSEVVHVFFGAHPFYGRKTRKHIT